MPPALPVEWNRPTPMTYKPGLVKVYSRNESVENVLPPAQAPVKLSSLPPNSNPNGV